MTDYFVQLQTSKIEFSVSKFGASMLPIELDHEHAWLSLVDNDIGSRLKIQFDQNLEQFIEHDALVISQRRPRVGPGLTLASLPNNLEALPGILRCKFHLDTFDQDVDEDFSLNHCVLEVRLPAVALLTPLGLVFIFTFGASILVFISTLSGMFHRLRHINIIIILPFTLHIVLNNIISS